MKIYLIFASLLIFPLINYAQEFPILEDTLALYNQGFLNIKSKNIKRHVSYLKHSYMLQEEYQNGNTSREYIKGSDSTFLFTEFYNFQKTDSITIHGKKREGLLYITNQTVGDTVITYNPDNYEKQISIDNLMIPIGRWNFYYENGQRSMTGLYSKNGKEGKWYNYNTTEYIIDKIYHFEKNILTKTEFVNLLLYKKRAKINQDLKGPWLISRNLDGSIYLLRHSDLRQMTNEKKVIFFEKDNSISGKISGRNIIPTIKGTWKLIGYNKLRIQQENQIIDYEIGYLSKSTLTLKLINR